MTRRAHRLPAATVLLLSVLGQGAIPLGAEPAAPVAPSPAATPGIDAALRSELLKMARDDQTDMPNATLLHLPRMKEIVARHGWPGKSLVGVDGAHAAWILVQHADSDPAFQRFCLDVMRAAFEKGEATAFELSYLTDRVLLAEGRPQMYGTQGAFGTNPPPEEEARVDANRLAIGLEPWRVFIERRRKTHAIPWLPDAKRP